MEGILLKELVEGIKARKPSDWKRMSEETGISYSMISQIGYDAYKSSPTLSNAEKMIGWLRSNPLWGRRATDKAQASNT
jgi:hypothetical protein